MIEVGKEYVKLNTVPGTVCVYAGGSVGRGTADEYSDLDLMVYVEHRGKSNENIDFEGELIQRHIHQFPSLQKVASDPWQFRFLKDARAINDPDRRFATLKSEAMQIFQSEEGKDKLYQGAKVVVESRKAWADSCVAKQTYHTGAMAAMAAWADAAFMYGYFECGSTETGKPISNLRHLPGIYTAITRNWPLDISDKEQEICLRMSSLNEYRRHLRECSGYKDAFSVASEHAALLSRKVDREIQRQDFVSVHELIYADAYDVILGVYKASLENHLNSLPLELKQGLEQLGFTELSERQIQNLCHSADEIVKAMPFA